MIHSKKCNYKTSCQNLKKNKRLLLVSFKFVYGKDTFFRQKTQKIFSDPARVWNTQSNPTQHLVNTAKPNHFIQYNEPLIYNNRSYIVFKRWRGKIYCERLVSLKITIMIEKYSQNEHDHHLFHQGHDIKSQS